MRAPALALSALLLFAAPAPAKELPPELKGLIEEGEKWFNEAGKTDLPDGKRNEARKNALVNLKTALEILNKHWDDNPSDQSALEDRIMKVGQMVYWIKKESPLSVLEAAGLGPKKPAAAPPPPPKEPPPPGTPGGGGNPFDKPEPKPEPKPGAAPAAPGRLPFADAFKKAEEYERKHRADTAGIMEHYHQLMADYPEALGDPLFMKAAERAGKANANLKDVYRKMRDDDPDSLKSAESAEVTRMILVLNQDLGSQDSAVRERAAKMLGMLGSGEAVFPLVKQMKKEKEEQALQAMAASVVAIGGRKAAEQTGKLRDDKDLGARSLEMLQAMTGRNAVDRRLALLEIGGYARATDDALAGKAVDFLVGVGAEGAHGLLEALDSKSVEVRLKVIPALASTGNPKVAGSLSKFLIRGDVPNTVKCRDAAIAAIKQIGRPGLPYLIEGFRGTATKQWTAFVIHEITGQYFNSNRPGDYQKWLKDEGLVAEDEKEK